ncbi:MAG: ABC transporter substrate-binding protein [Deltaproteobacteria bacterium]|jgi:taurine transport system substrate-binding protein|nr:ABC transporter substrate-binding protein [Deltaproteobacteria bacterium]
MRTRTSTPSRAASFALALAAAAALLLPGTLAAQGTDPATGEKYPPVFNIATFNSATATAIPIQEGYFNDLGVPAKIVFFDSGRDINTAFASRSIEAATVGSSPVSLGVSNNLGYEVVFINDVIGPAESLAVTKKSGIKTVGDLKGKKIATPFASTAHYSLLAALLQEGVDPSEVTILDLQTQDILASWIRGDIDGAYVWTPVLEELVRNDGTVITDSAKLAEKGAITADVSVVSKEFAAKYPTLVTNYVKALVRTNGLINDSPDQAAGIVAKNIEIDVPTAAAQLAGNNYVRGADQLSPRYLGPKGKPGDFAKTLKDTADFHVSQNNLDKAGDLSIYQAAVNGGFLEDALK